MLDVTCPVFLILLWHRLFEDGPNTFSGAPSKAGMKEIPSQLKKKEEKIMF